MLLSGESTTSAFIHLNLLLKELTSPLNISDMVMCCDSVMEIRIIVQGYCPKEILPRQVPPVQMVQVVTAGLENDCVLWI